MTSTLTPPTTVTDTTCTHDHVEVAPTEQEFTIGGVKITAADEAAALRKYKRMVRAQALKAKDDMGWCVEGTNERLRILGVREIGKGVPMRVTVTATRTAYMTIDAEDLEEARQIVADGGPDLLQVATSTVGGRGWKVNGVEALDGELISTSKQRKVDDEDDTVAAFNHRGEYIDGLTSCDRYNRGTGYYCTMPAGHSGQHAAGNGRRIVAVWDNRSN